MKRKFIGYISILMLVLQINSAGCKSQSNVTFGQLISDPGRYSGKRVTVEGFYFDSFEFMGLCEKLIVLNNGRFAPDGEVFWLNGGLPKEIYDKLSAQQVEMGGFTQHYGKMLVTGKFEYGGMYSHLGGFDYQITPEKVELLPSSK